MIIDLHSRFSCWFVVALCFVWFTACGSNNGGQADSDGGQDSQDVTVSDESGSVETGSDIAETSTPAPVCALLPDRAEQGQSINLTLVCSHFELSEDTQVSFGPNISLLGTQLLSSHQLHLPIRIGYDAGVGARDIDVLNGNGDRQMVLRSGFTVLATDETSGMVIFSHRKASVWDPERILAGGIFSRWSDTGNGFW